MNVSDQLDFSRDYWYECACANVMIAYHYDTPQQVSSRLGHSDLAVSDVTAWDHYEINVRSWCDLISLRNLWYQDDVWKMSCIYWVGHSAVKILSLHVPTRLIDNLIRTQCYWQLFLVRFSVKKSEVAKIWSKLKLSKGTLQSMKQGGFCLSLFRIDTKHTHFVNKFNWRANKLKI